MMNESQRIIREKKKKKANENPLTLFFEKKNEDIQKGKMTFLEKELSCQRGKEFDGWIGWRKIKEHKKNER